MSVRSNILAMRGYVPGEQPQAGKFIKLNTNENPYPPSERVAPAVMAALKHGLTRYPDPVAESFRIQASQVLQVPSDWILCGNGSDDILTIVTRTFVGENEGLRVPHPTYVLYRTLAQIQAATISEVFFDDRWQLPHSFCEGDFRLAIIPNPNSPSGTLLTPRAVEALAGKLNCPLLVDEAYADFSDHNCLDLVRTHPNVMVSRSLSKSYGLAGLRFGYLVARPEVIEHLMKVKDSYNCDSLSIAAATAALGDVGWFQHNRQRILEQRDRLAAGMRERGFHVPDSQANFVWCEDPNRDLKSLYQQLKANRVLVRYMHYDRWNEGIRISVGTSDQVDALFTVLDTLLSN